MTFLFHVRKVTASSPLHVHLRDFSSSVDVLRHILHVRLHLFTQVDFRFVTLVSGTSIVRGNEAQMLPL